jgi:hypothetical protein
MNDFLLLSTRRLSNKNASIVTLSASCAAEDSLCSHAGHRPLPIRHSALRMMPHTRKWIFASPLGKIAATTSIPVPLYKSFVSRIERYHSFWAPFELVKSTLHTSSRLRPLRWTLDMLKQAAMTLYSFYDLVLESKRCSQGSCTRNQ